VSVLKCIYAEVDLDGSKYILTDQSWYQISADFVKEVEDTCNLIPECTTIFPDYEISVHGIEGSNEGEAGYNKTLVSADNTNRTLFDRNLISWSGITSIEFCDVYINSKQLIHVKRYGGSSSLSHLFQQGAVSSELFVSEQRFRNKVNELMPESERTETVDPHKYEVVFLIINKSEKLLKLPFFSKVTLKSIARRLQTYGYRVSLSRVKSV